MFTMEKLLGIFNGKKAKTNQPDNSVSTSETLFNAKVSAIEGTPFACVKKDENEYFVVFGQHKITDKTFTSRGAAIKWTESQDWNSILNVIGIYVEHALKEFNLKNKN